MLKEEKPRFMFDLEKQIKEPAFRNQTLKDVEKKINDIKEQLRKGAANPKDFDQLSLLLNGYMSLQKVLNTVSK
ncbi:MAG: DUF5398 family protein [Verrucomicrobiota bacterium]|nr:DUF5398 family protein [Verrucomicrobiota bacterium]